MALLAATAAIISSSLKLSPVNIPATITIFVTTNTVAMVTIVMVASLFLEVAYLVLELVNILQDTAMDPTVSMHNIIMIASLVITKICSKCSVLSGGATNTIYENIVVMIATTTDPIITIVSVIFLLCCRNGLVMARVRLVDKTAVIIPETPPMHCTKP